MCTSNRTALGLVSLTGRAGGQMIPRMESGAVRIGQHVRGVIAPGDKPSL